MKVLRICFRGRTGSFRIPFSISGVQLTTPVPSYSNLVGLISCCVGDMMKKETTQIGFEFSYEAKALDLERFIRWDFNAKSIGKPILNSAGPGVRQREYLINPQLNLYLTNTSLKSFFITPKGIPTLGRSQDLVCIECVEEIEIEPVKEGNIGGTLIPYDIFGDNIVNGFLLRLPEYIEYNEQDRKRIPINNVMFLATNSIKNKKTHIKLNENLYGSKSFANKDDCVYIHKWIS
jgi:CRISPR-associated protein Cas5t